MPQKIWSKPPYTIHTWAERGYGSVSVTDANGREVASWQDDDLWQMFEDGFFEGSVNQTYKHDYTFAKSVMQYLIHLKAIRPRDKDKFEIE